jgi:Asp-tRNA(Asn)/Glu-tRNA(Gln) amidotransferase B subunit
VLPSSGKSKNNSLKPHYYRIYKTIQDNSIHGESDFRDVVLHKFGPKKLLDLLTLIKDQQISTENGKVITKMITDGDERMPTEIAEALGFTGEVILPQDLLDAVSEVIKTNPQTVEQISLTTKASPIMALVNKTIDLVNRKCDPVMVRYLLEKEMENMKNKTESKQQK